MKVLILGGGYGGIFAASNLCKEKRIQVTLVNPGRNHLLLQKTHRIASGELGEQDVTIDISEALGKDVRHIRGRCERVDFSVKEAHIITADGKTVTEDFDAVIVAIGAENEYFQVEGAEEFSFSLGSLRDSIDLRSAIDRLKPRSVVTIAGGGATGISLAGALSEEHGNRFTIRVIEAQNEILSGWQQVVVEMAAAYLQKNNVEILRSRPIKKIGPNSVTLASGEELPSDLTIWTAGIRGREIECSPTISRTGSGRIMVDELSRIISSEGQAIQDAYAIGDNCAYPLNKEGFAPQLAQFAVRQARNVAKNILAKESGNEMKKLDYVQKGQILSLGRDCVGTLNGLPISGWLCENTEDFIVDNYVKALLNRGEGLEGRVYDESSSEVEFMTSINFLTYLWKKLMRLN